MLDKKYVFICGGSLVFGQEIVQLTIMRELALRGAQVHCVVSGWNDGRFMRHLEEARIPYTVAYLGKLTVQPRQIGWMVDTLKHLVGARRVVRRVLQQVHPDVIVAANRDSVLLLSGVLRRYPVAFHVQELPDLNVRGRTWTRVLSASVNRFIAASMFVKRRLVDLGVPPERVLVAEAGIHLPSPEAVRGSRNGARERPATIGICGQIAPWKGHAELVEALGILHDRGIAFELAIFGGGEESFLSSLKQRIEQLGFVQRVRWPGYESDRDRMYGACDVIVAPSQFDDPFPTTVLEAGAYGLPVVGTARGGIPEQIVDGVTGWIVADNDVEALADRLETLLTSEDVRTRFGGQARARISEAFQAAHMVDRFLAALEDVETQAR